MSFVNSLWRSSYLGREHDTSSQEPATPALESFNYSRDDYDWLEGILDTSSSHPNVDREAQLVKSMPALFATSLPPCGLELQLAYQNVLHRLRHVHVYLASFETIAPSPASLALRVCETVYEHPKDEDLVKGNTSWRRQTVFLMERKWASWFVKEAQLGARWETMDEREKKVQRIICGESVMPLELKLGVCSRMTRAWVAWRDERRKDLVGEDWETVEEDEEIGS